MTEVCLLSRGKFLLANCIFRSCDVCLVCRYELWLVLSWSRVDKICLCLRRVAQVGEQARVEKGLALDIWEDARFM